MKPNAIALPQHPAFVRIFFWFKIPAPPVRRRATQTLVSLRPKPPYHKAQVQLGKCHACVLMPNIHNP
jgi:hypothetical protein